jgi:nucleoside-diphosphate-sugar epimerase
MSSTPASDSVVLVTGVNGFLGSHIADQLLNAGFRVRGTVRSIPKAENIRKTLVEKGMDRDDLKLFRCQILLSMELSMKLLKVSWRHIAENLKLLHTEFY